MSPKSPDSRGPRFYGILSDPWRKLISVGLGILLWYQLNASITKTHTGICGSLTSFVSSSSCGGVSITR